MVKAMIGIVLITILTMGCKVKDRNQESNTATNSKEKSISWLIAGNDHKGWAIESFTVNGEDKLKGLNPCQLDNVDFYFRNLVFESSEGPSPCNPGDPEILKRGKWSLNADSTAIEVKLGTDLFTLRIVEITENRLHYRSEIKGQVTEAVLKSSDFSYMTSIQADTTR